MKRQNKKKPITIKDIFPGLRKKQRLEMEKALHDYAEIAWRVVVRLEREQWEAQIREKLEPPEPLENQERNA